MSDVHAVSDHASSLLTDSSHGDRLQKVLAEAGVGSRRACEVMIGEGRVRVNGQLVTKLPAWADIAADRIEVDGRALRRVQPGRQAEHVYIALHKPRHVICTASDPQGRRCVMDMVKLTGRFSHARVFPVGRLDADSTGLLLLTNDGELANRLMHPRYGLEKQYQVTIRGLLSEADARRLKEGLYLGARRASGAKKAVMSSVRIVSRKRDRRHGDSTVVNVTLGEGQNREIRRMLARLGFRVRRLQRVAIGPVRLKGLASGHWRFIEGAERGRLLRAATAAGRQSVRGS